MDEKSMINFIVLLDIGWPPKGGSSAMREGTALLTVPERYTHEQAQEMAQKVKEALGVQHVLVLPEGVNVSRI